MESDLSAIRSSPSSADSTLVIEPKNIKSKKSRRGLKKSHGCEEPGCGKSFTRLEHLLRHQLNHRPKEIFYCSWPDCNRKFVREDLKIRHEKRHTKRQGDTIVTTPKLKRTTMLEIPAVLPNEPQFEFVHTNPKTPAESITLPSFSNDSLVINPEILNQTESGGTLNTDPLALPGSTTDIISWLFSDTMLDNVRDPLLSPGTYTLESPMSLQNLLAPPALENDSGIGEPKRKQMLTFLPTLKTELVAHNLSEDAPFQNKYLNSYWTKFHVQYPILHKPTFAPDKCPSGLLWVIIAIGAALVGENMLAKIIATPLRWAIFESEEFDPPARLWVIQSLLLLEIYEKVMGDRKTHVRAHVHHGTTLQLIRRGALLTGASMSNDNYCNDSNTFDDDGYLSSKNGDPWKRWIQGEATKRAALLAFVIDTHHSVLFSHPSLISIHEIRLSLPCSQTLWDSFPTTSEDHRKITNVITLPLIEAVKMMLNKKSFEYSPFGRQVLLSGLLSIANQMQQRDILLDSIVWSNQTQGSSVVTNNSGYPAWKENIRSSYDFLGSDFKVQIEQQTIALNKLNSTTSEALQTETQFMVTGCADPFHHIAHIGLHVTMMDLYLYGGTPILFSQSSHKSDFEKAARNISNWANSPHGSDAVKQAIYLLDEMFSENPVHTCPNPWSYPAAASAKADYNSINESNTITTTFKPYKAKTDPVSHRPHIVFICTMIVWSYFYILDGPEAEFLQYSESNGQKRVNSNMQPAEREQESEQMANLALQKIEHIPSKTSGLEYIRWLAARFSAEDKKTACKIACPNATDMATITASTSAAAATGNTTEIFDTDSGTCDSNFLASEDRNNLIGLLRVVIEALEDCQWTIVREDRRLLIHCLERSMGKIATKCHYF